MYTVTCCFNDLPIKIRIMLNMFTGIGIGACIVYICSKLKNPGQIYRVWDFIFSSIEKVMK